MATISTTGTLQPRFDKFDNPMGPNNVPRYPFAPIGRFVWDGSVNAIATTDPDIQEIAITCVVPTGYFLRFTNVSWSGLVTDAAAVSDLNEWSDKAQLTFTQNNVNFQIALQKPAVALASTITNLFSSVNYVPQGGTNWNRLYRNEFTSSGVIFRTVKLSTNNTAATTFASQMEALIYTIEQGNEPYIYTAFMSDGSSGGTVV